MDCHFCGEKLIEGILIVPVADIRLLILTILKIWIRWKRNIPKLAFWNCQRKS
ncbi:hypothetical protein [Methanobrevibacter sp.]|uniref:hypothetical protein n=1 Tax=Methanobrevibacter sp. TaxID=66852 RepID=UPI003870CD99